MSRSIEVLDESVSKAIHASWVYPKVASIVCSLTQNAIQNSPKTKVELHISLAPFWQISCTHDGDVMDISRTDKIESLSHLGILKIETNGQKFTKENENMIYSRSGAKFHSVILEDFFGNVPIRRICLLSESTLVSELRDVQMILKAMSFLCPNLSISLQIQRNFDDRLTQILQLQPVTSEHLRYEQVYGVSVEQSDFTFIDEQFDNIIKIRGFIREESHSTKEIQHIFINETLMNPLNAGQQGGFYCHLQNLVNRCVYSNFNSCNIAYVIILWINPQYENEESMGRTSEILEELLHYSLHNPLHPKQHVPSFYSSNEECISIKTFSKGRVDLNRTGQAAERLDRNILLPDRFTPLPFPKVSMPANQNDLADDIQPQGSSSIRFAIEPHSVPCHVLRQVDGKYVACMNQTFSELILVDQHAAHERIRFERKLADYISLCITNSLKTKRVYKKVFQHRQTWQLLQEQFTDFSNLLQFWAIDIELVDSEDHVLVKHLPTLLKLESAEEILDFLSLLSTWMESIEPRRKLKEVRTAIHESSSKHSLWLIAFRHAPPMIVEKIASSSCRGSIMFNDILSSRQCTQLIDELGKTSLPLQCAHGRSSAVIICEMGKVPSFTLENSAIDWSRFSEF